LGNLWGWHSETRWRLFLGALRDALVKIGIDEKEAARFGVYLNG